MGNRKAPERADFSNPVHALYFGDHAARYEFAASFARGKRVVDAACGSGYGLARLKRARATMCLGIDKDAATIDRDRRMYGSLGIEFRCADCETFDFRGCNPDVISSFETVEHLVNPARFVNRAQKALHDDGVFIVSCSNNEPLGENPYHLHSWDADAFHEMLGTHFREVVILGEVLTPSARATAEFAKYVESRLGLLWNQPWTRAWRVVRRLFGRECLPTRPQYCSILAGQHDWWFVPEPDDAAICLLAICRHPRP